MDRSSDGYVTLQNYFQMPDDFLSVDVSCLNSVVKETDRQASTVRILNILASCKCTTLGDIMALRWDELSEIRYFGGTYESYLIDLLDRIMEDEQEFRNQNVKEIMAGGPSAIGNVILNIQSKIRKCTLHKPKCYRIPSEARLIPVSKWRIGDVVGWVDFDTAEQTVAFHKEKLSRLEYRMCKRCFSDEVRRLFMERGTNQLPQYPIS